MKKKKYNIVDLDKYQNYYRFDYYGLQSCWICGKTISWRRGKYEHGSIGCYCKKCGWKIDKVNRKLYLTDEQLELADLNRIEDMLRDKPPYEFKF